MKSTMKRNRISVFVGALLFCLAAPTFAAGPLFVCDAGQAFLWPGGGANIPWNPDQGGLGPLTNAQAIDLVADAFQVWEDVPTASTTFLQGAALPEDVDETNFLPYLEPVAPDGLSAIVFDEDGAIFDLLFGPGSGVLGFASPEWADFTTCEILEGVSFINGGAFTGPTAEQEALDILVHEFGHYQDLAHTVVNGQIALGDHSGPTPNDTFPLPPTLASLLIETMYPFYFGPDAGTSTLQRDDVSSVSTLYPEPTFGTLFGTITGTIFAPNGTTPLTGVNVIARNVLDPYGDAVSAISSDYAFDFTPGSPFVGVYTLRGLTPGAQYAVFVDEILAGGFSTPPLFPLPGPEELYNGAGESNNGGTDVPSVFTPVASAPGVTTSGINIIFNAPAPGAPLPVGDDGFVELFMPFTFDICGQKFDSVFVNANGNLTFGVPSGDFSESIVEHLAGPPRVAGFWDDLNPGAGGTVSFQQTSSSFTVTWENVPEFVATGSNTFSIKLWRFTGFVELTHTALTAADGLVGVSCGGAITSGFERPDNLSSSFVHLLQLQPARFELFGPGNAVDLVGRTTRFLAFARFHDRFENNDTIARARKISTPFSTESILSYTEINPLGDDADFFEVRLDANEFMAVEVVRGANVDSVIGIFDANTNELLAVDDDSGDGLLSRLLVQGDVNRKLAIAVSTFPDFDFTGDGESSGRYVLQVTKYKGTLVAAGDDTSTPVTFGFTFPYQGSNWTGAFLNSNGNFTFGAGSTDFSPSVPEFLAGPPRIAPRWDDLDASDGLVIASPGHNKVTYHFVSVPEFFTTSPNYFSLELEKDGDFKIDYLATSRTDGLSGITQGGGAADPGETNLSADDNHDADGTTYELFNPSDVFSFDLFYSDLRFDD